VVEDLVAAILGADDATLAREDVTIPGRAGASDDPDAAGGAEAREAAVGAVLHAATSPPFMTACRVVVVHDVGALSAAEAEPIVRFLDDPLDTTVLVLVAGGGTIPPALTKKLKEVRAEEHAPDSEKTVDVLRAAAHDAGITLDADAARTVAAHYGDDAGRVTSLVTVLASAFGPGARVSASDLAPYLGEAGALPSYQLTNAIEEGDPAGALVVLQRLLTATTAQQPRPMHPLQLMGVLNGYYRRILRLDDPAVRSSADAVAALGGKVKEFPARKALAQARVLGTDGIRQAFDALFQADLDLKGARAIPEDAVMQVLVVRLARLSARRVGGRRSRSR